VKEPDKDDIRWQQRLANYRRALAQLKKAVDLSQTRDLSELEQQGLIQAFEFTHELAWKVMKDYFVYQGNLLITGSRDAVREAFAVQLIADGQGWMDMIKSRNQSSHTYNPETADAVVKDVVERYFGLFESFAKHMESLARE
jgi:nucleotidyltransferase substrate binding protein (TIGR01987 family)